MLRALQLHDYHTWKSIICLVLYCKAFEISSTVRLLDVCRNISITYSLGVKSKLILALRPLFNSQGFCSSASLHGSTRTSCTVHASTTSAENKNSKQNVRSFSFEKQTGIKCKIQTFCEIYFTYFLFYRMSINFSCLDHSRLNGHLLKKFTLIISSYTTNIFK